MIESGRVDRGAMVVHRFKLDDIEAVHGLFANQRDGVFKVAITRWSARQQSTAARPGGRCGQVVPGTSPSHPSP